MATKAQLEQAMANMPTKAIAKALTDTLQTVSHIPWVKIEVDGDDVQVRYATASANVLDLVNQPRVALETFAVKIAEAMDDSPPLKEEGITGSNLLYKALTNYKPPKPPVWPWVLGGLVVFALYRTGEK